MTTALCYNAKAKTYIGQWEGYSFCKEVISDGVLISV